MQSMIAMSELVEMLSRCPACDGGQLHDLPVPGRWYGEALFRPYRGRFGLCACRSCDLVFTNPRPTAALLARIYQSAEPGDHLHDPSAGVALKARLDTIERLVPVRGSFLDFGCGGGDLLRAALDRGWRGIGYDISEPAIAACRVRGLPVTDKLTSLGHQRFAAIYLSHVFEHVGTPRAVLGMLNDLLTATGRLFIEVPNERSLRARVSLPVLSRWAGFDERYRAFPIHLFYYSAASLRVMLERSGLRIVTTATSGVGVDELRFQAEPESTPIATHERPASSSRFARSKRLVKAAMFSAGLGESLMVAAARGDIGDQTRIKRSVSSVESLPTPS